MDAEEASFHETKSDFYARLHLRAEPVLSETSDAYSNMANVSALLYNLFREHYESPVNWVGFYVCKTAVNTELKAHQPTWEVLTLGPFVGKPARTLIPFSKGVCGRCVTDRKTQVVSDVHAVEYHLSCDPASKSEIVVPIWSQGPNPRVVAVLDIDSPVVNCFQAEDGVQLELLAQNLSKASYWVSADVVVASDLAAQDDTCSLSAPH